MHRNSAMKIFLLTLLALPSFAVTPLLDYTWRVAKDPSTPFSSIEKGCLKSAAEKDNTPAEVFTCIASQRGNWTHEEIYCIFNAVLFGAGLNGTFVKDFCDFVSNTQSNSDGLKLIKELYNFSQAFDKDLFNYVIGQILNDANGESNIANFYAYSKSTIKKGSRSHLVPVTPDPISSQN